jgi:hypothetical protein
MHDPQDPRESLDELIACFPRLFHGGPPRIPGYIASGWHPIVMDLFHKIDQLLDDGEADQFRLVQIKEKFGRLRVYVTLADHYDLVGDIHQPGGVVTIKLPASDRESPRPSKLDVIQGYITEAAARSGIRCDVCGEPGVLRPGGWVRTLCDRHAAERDAGRDPKET